MSRQFGGGTGEEGTERERAYRDNEPACQAGDLRRLIERIANQLNDSDQRHSATLAQMQSRLDILGAQARHHKANLPQEFAPAFERIEKGISALGERITSSHDPLNERDADGLTNFDDGHLYETAQSMASIAPPATTQPAIDSLAGLSTQTTPTHATSETIQPVEPAYAIEPVMANDETAWQQQDAEALTTHYEQEFGTITTDADGADRTDPNKVHTDDRRPFDGRLEAIADVEMPRPHSTNSAPQDVRAHLHDGERDWLEGQFVDIARKIEDTLAQRSSDTGFADLGERFENLEQRFGSAMHEVATRSDLEALQALEAHISELAEQFDVSRNQLSRLDNIEHSLAAVIDRLTDPRFDNALDRSGAEEQNLEHLISSAVDQIAQRLPATQPEMPDLKSFAEGIAAATAERVASHFAEIAPAHVQGTQSDVDAIRQLLDQFVNEQREGEEQTAIVLDTMQRALIRVLDRVDALETSHSKATADYGRYDAEPTGTRPFESTPTSADGAKSGAPIQDGTYQPPEREAGPRPSVNATPPSSTAHQPPPQPSTPASIERLRQGFVADARRAKEKAATAAPQTTADFDPDGPVVQLGQAATGNVRLSMPRAEPPKTDVEKNTGIINKLRNPSRKLLVAAIVLMIAIPGALMLLKKDQAAAPAPAAIERSEGPNERAITPVSPTRQINEGSGLKLDGAVQVPKAATPDTEQKTAPGRSSSITPDLLNTGKSATGIETSPTSRDDLTRTPPQTQSRGAGQGIEAPAQVNELHNLRLPAAASTNGGPPAGITVATSRRAPSLAQLERLSERNTAAQLSNQLGQAQVNAVPAALIPEFMGGETTSNAAPATPGLQASVSQAHRQPLNLPPAQVGPLSLRMAAANGNPSAEFAVAARFADGTGVKQDLEEAMRWYQRSASHGFAQSQYRLATFYERGLGVTQDIARAKIWYQRAAENGNVKAMHNLAVLSAGRTAKVPDYKAAAQWFKSAAEHGLADSQFNLAVLYESGLGEAQDNQAAYFWFALAARNGDTEALRRHKELEQAMKPAELAEANRKLNNWRQKQADRVANDPLAASEAWKAQAAAEGAI